MIKVYTYTVFFLIIVAICIPLLIFKIHNTDGDVLTFKPRPENDSSYLSRYYQVKFRSIDEIYNYIKDLVGSYSFFCELNRIGHTTTKGSYQGLPIYLLKISSGFPKPIVLIIGGINANDWKSTTSILYIANQLLSNCSKAGQLITTYDWHFIPILNPDGYNYSHTSPSTIEWVKNIARWSMDYMGVNLDHNFGIKWRKKFNYNEDTYPGIKPFSEVESRTLRDYILQIKDYIEMVIILKSPGNKLYNEPAITYPWSHTPTKPSNWVLLQYLAVVGAAAAQNSTGTKYIVKQSGRLLSKQFGRIDDWIFNTGIKRVLTVQTKFVADLIVDPYESIVKMGAEMYAIIKEMSITAFHQPLSYRKTHRKINVNNEIVLNPHKQRDTTISYRKRGLDDATTTPVTSSSEEKPLSKQSLER